MGDGRDAEFARVERIFPDTYRAHSAIPDRAKRYIQQAFAALAQPDASVMMSSSAVDAMLKAKGFSQGSLYERIQRATDDGVLTRVMKDWADRVRLDANNVRHADEEEPHMTRNDAHRAFTFARSLSEFLFIIPSLMPDEDGDMN
ncbi:MAG: DUF4145 domain-containing protein [Pseudomonadota bacterium]